MKKNVLIISGLILTMFIISCSKNKPVTEQLTYNEINKLIEQDHLYEKIIKEIEMIRTVFDNDIVLKSKFVGLTYKDFYVYTKKVTDTTFLNNINDSIDNKYNIYADSLLVLYKEKVDEKIKYYFDLTEECRRTGWKDFNSIKGIEIPTKMSIIIRNWEVYGFDKMDNLPQDLYIELIGELFSVEVISYEDFKIEHINLEKQNIDNVSFLLEELINKTEKESI